MIIFRYLSREVLITALAVSSVLLLIISSAHLIGYFADAAAGEISTSVVLQLVLNRIPRFLELLLPLGLFLGILLAHGRFYLDSEMVVLSACGMSNRRLIGYTLAPGLLVALLVGFVSLYLAPAGMYESKRIVAEQRSRTELEMVIPGAFQTSKSGQVTYVREVSPAGDLIDLFITGEKQGVPYLITAPRGEQRFVEDQGRYLVLHEGYRYQGRPGIDNFEELGFSKYGLRLPDPRLSAPILHLDAIPTTELWGATDSARVSRLHWRLSLPVLALVVVFLAVPLAKTDPRRGRYAKLIPSILVYQLYVASLTGSRSAVEQGDVGPWAIWVVHLCALLLALSFTRFEPLWVRVLQHLPSLSRRRSISGVGGAN